MRSNQLFPVLLALAVTGCAHKGAQDVASTTDKAAGTTAAAKPAADNGGTKVHKLASGLIYEDVVVGNGTMADPGLTVAVDYTGTLMDGTLFDTSKKAGGRPYAFVLGSGSVIKGWDEGIKGMRVGGKRILTVPPDMGYGAAGMGPIPPNATLRFECELMDVH